MGPSMRGMLAIAALALTGCLADPRVGEPIPGGGGGGTSASFSSLGQTVFTPRCATSACHTGSPPANNVPVSLDADQAYQELVGVPATELPSMNLVEPGDASRSYLVLKLRDTQRLEGGSGDRMPLFDVPLTEDELQAIEAWITNGAPND